MCTMLRPLLLVFVSVVVCLSAEADAASKLLAPAELLNDITSAEVSAHLRFLGDVALEGRAPGTRGEDIAAKYIESQMRLMGLQPAFANSSFTQDVPLVGVRVGLPAGDLKCASSTAYAGRTDVGLDMVFAQDYVFTTDLSSNSVSFSSSELVFVGHGIYAPDYGWDDYKGLDITGKTVVMLVNQPAAFNASSETYYGRWTYKYEEARRRSAAAVLLVHTNDTAGYPWSVVVSSNTGEQVRVAGAVPSPLTLRGWVTSSAADTLAGMFGASLDIWFSIANDMSFKPITAPVACSTQAVLFYRPFQGQNVAGYVSAGAATGLTAPLSSESVVISGHLDHLGVRNGSVYAGYLDNASGASMTLSVARAFARYVSSAGQVLARSVVFLCPTAEESGLLGSQYYVQQPPVQLPLAGIRASINFDVGNAWGPTTDMTVLGQSKSSLGDLICQLAPQLNITCSPDAAPSQGLFFRSDHFSFARAGVPGVWINTGSSFIGQPPDYYQRVVQGQYYYSRYHQPSDVYDPAYTYDGMVQQMQLGAAAAYALSADTSITPQCYGQCW